MKFPFNQKKKKEKEMRNHEAQYEAQATQTVDSNLEAQ